MVEQPVPLWLLIPGVVIFAVGILGLVMSWPVLKERRESERVGGKR